MPGISSGVSAIAEVMSRRMQVIGTVDAAAENRHNKKELITERWGRAASPFARKDPYDETIPCGMPRVRHERRCARTNKRRCARTNTSSGGLRHGRPVRQGCLLYTSP